jgi:hypothetical protein
MTFCSFDDAERDRETTGVLDVHDHLRSALRLYLADSTEGRVVIADFRRHPMRDCLLLKCDGTERMLVHAAAD